MHQISAPQLSTVDLIDELEARIAAIRGRNGHVVAASTDAAASSELRAEMERAEVSPAELARAMDVPHADLNAWMSGESSVPQWALAATRLVALLPRAERHKLINGRRAAARESTHRTHPFSRIEDL